MNEDWVKRKFREIVNPSRLVFVEQALGSTVGASDCFMLCPNGFFMPTEFKWWDVLASGAIKIDLRPAQISFHTKLNKMGGKSIIVFGTTFGHGNSPKLYFINAWGICLYLIEDDNSDLGGFIYSRKMLRLDTMSEDEFFRTIGATRFWV